jgi:hypothetical protein
MAKQREAVGEIACLLCKRDAELHAFEERTKLDPDSDGGGKPTYPKKFFVICPPVKGYRGCGTILANGAGAQSQLMELGRIFGPAGKPVKPVQIEIDQTTRPNTAVIQAQPPKAHVSDMPPPKTSKNPFALW